MADGEKGQRHLSFSRMLKRTALVGGDMVRFIAFDFVLRIVFSGVMGMPLIVKIARVDFDDRPGYAARLRVPAHVIADLERLRHLQLSF